uniref:Reverse transcriptase Ty1/copia-type domain-containing protein n=1 Tax=Lactuca sativa TaxID=4236 RepID=A0A9R1VZS6_LACSA|nr:hypothetical protein LSAT_V11C400166600 [Lactuca sativa]
MDCRWFGFIINSKINLLFLKLPLQIFMKNQLVFCIITYQWMLSNKMKHGLLFLDLIREMCLDPNGFHTKYKSDGTIKQYKPCLVAQRYTYILGLKYSHNFSLVVKASTVRIVLLLVEIHHWQLHQLDVNKPLGFLALYGLKQAPRAWFQRLIAFLLQNGFSCSRTDTSLFFFKRGFCIMYLLVYVDDMILTGIQESVITSCIARFYNEFEIKDLRDLNCFFGTRGGLH